jgi:protein involved in polysaccharide export with SLBB domain
MTIDIDHLNEAQLIDLNRRVVTRLNFLQQMRAHASMLSFSVGDRVTFQPSGQPPLSGIITKYNRKTVTVLTDTRQQWNVAPTLLRRTVPTEAPSVLSSPGT